MQRPLTVFVCSTFSDLTAEREAVLDAIRRLQLQHESMEFFGARPDAAIEVCLEQVRKSEILVVIVGHKYGSIVRELGVSYSQAEYEEGYQLGKPCLVYVRDENVPVLPKNIERDPEKARLLDRWKETLNSRHTIATFRDGNQLAVQVAADLARTIRELEAAAQVRAQALSQVKEGFAEAVQALLADAIRQGVSEGALLSAFRRAVSDTLVQEGRRGITAFLSYGSSDKELVRRVAKGLSQHELNVWFDETNIQPGADWIKEIEKGLDAADFLVFFISPRSLKSGWAMQELQAALLRQVSGERGAKVIPVLLEDADVPPLLRSIQWVDMRDGDVEAAVKKLVAAMRFHMTANPFVRHRSGQSGS